jgi:LysM repeat protein
MTIAAPAAASIAAAVCMSPQAFASTSSPTVPGTGSYQTGAPYAELAPMAWPTTQLDAKSAPVVKSAPKASPAVWYTVKSGDTLSGIAGRFYQNPAAWPAIYWANKGQISSADVIQPGQRLRIPAKPAHIPAAPATPAPVSTAPAPATTQVSAPVAAPVQATQASTYTGSGSSFQQCVIARESGGNSQIMNSSGHYGLYQFSYSTWVAYGGSPSSFGNASVGQQNQVFNNAIAAGGQGNWAPYDGC